MNPEELLDQTEAELNAAAYDEEANGGMDRRQFVLMSLVAAAATTFGVNAARAQGAPGDAAVATGGPSTLQQQAQAAPVQLGNGEAPALQFQPYPGGTGALMEKLAKERGRAAFDRAVFKVEKWSGAVRRSCRQVGWSVDLCGARGMNRDLQLQQSFQIVQTNNICIPTNRIRNSRSLHIATEKTFIVERTVFASQLLFEILRTVRTETEDRRSTIPVNQ